MQGQEVQIERQKISLLHKSMTEIWAALIGVAATTVVVAVSNNSSRKERDIRELFHRINALEKQVATMKPRNWRS